MHQTNIFDEIIVDNFAGGGGASTGMELATGKPVAIAINHDPDAILLHRTNHPYTEHLQASVWDVDPVDVCKGRPVGLAWFSPDCKHFSKAKGSALVDRKIRGLAWIVLRWAAKVRPRVIMLENVEEFQTWGPVRKGKPVKKKAGQTFHKWKQQLSDLGYDIQHRELIAADYGAPTTRKRFALIARCDGQPIVWPKPTHAPRESEAVKSGKLLPWRSAAEIIDWSIPGYSIFASKQEIKKKYGVNAVRPLARNTLRRVIRGVDKFTIRSGKPFLIECNHSGGGHIRSIEDAVNTVTGKFTCGVINPVMAPFVAQQKFQNAPQDIARPLSTVTAVGSHEVVAANLIQYHTEQTENVRASGLDKPIQTVDASNRYGLACANLVEYYGNGNPLDITEPMHTATSHDREAVVAAHVVKYKGQELGQYPTDALNTITAINEYADCRTVLVKADGCIDLGNWQQIRSLLNEFCGYHLADDDVLLLIINEVHYFIADITLRMLTPRELYKAMGFPADYIIERDYLGNEYKKNKQVARCGNAVCPPMAEAMVRANFPEWNKVTIETMAEFHNAVAV